MTQDPSMKSRSTSRSSWHVVAASGPPGLLPRVQRETAAVRLRVAVYAAMLREGLQPHPLVSQVLFLILLVLMAAGLWR